MILDILSPPLQAHTIVPSHELDNRVPLLIYKQFDLPSRCRMLFPKYKGLSGFKTITSFII